MGIKSIHPKQTQKQKAKESGFSDSTNKWYGNDMEVCFW